jgi:Phospholipase_D-nuclease N-terminal
MYAFLLFAQNGPDAGGELLGGVLAFVIFLWVLGIVATVLWIWAMIDAVINEPTPESKILWFLVIFFLHFLGAVVYLIVRKRGGARSAAG